MLFTFQSSPGQKAGCNPTGWRTIQTHYMPFQSSPGQKAGCNRRALGLRQQVSKVSILTRPEGRVQPAGEKIYEDIQEVSILTRPEGRVQRPFWPSPPGPCYRGFNPHPARRPGATARCDACKVRYSPFQSSPGQKAGCNNRRGGISQIVPSVSILTRPEGRVQPSVGQAYTTSQYRFQSSPGQKAGCNTDSELAAQFYADRGFNPHPARRPGATTRVRGTDSNRRMFQSSPGQKAGCNCVGG